jgi:hypothetical protein
VITALKAMLERLGDSGETNCSNAPGTNATPADQRRFRAHADGDGALADSRLMMRRMLVPQSQQIFERLVRIEARIFGRDRMRNLRPL